MIAFWPNESASKTRLPAACSFLTTPKALVISVGSGKILESGKRLPLSVKAGDQVLIGKYSGSDVKLDGEEHIILREDDILAILEN
jgi:co-chaperonin GroES (HSP10)